MNYPSVRRYHFSENCQLRPLLSGLDKKIDQWAARVKYTKRVTEKLRKQVDEIGKIIQSKQVMTRGMLIRELNKIKVHFQINKDVDRQILNQAIAYLSLACYHALGLKPYPVQLMAVIGLYKGYLVEMETGEGKTLVVGLSSILYAWEGHPCHILTVNDYLAERDMNIVQPLYKYCQVSCSIVTSSMHPEQRMSGYLANIVYTTSNELLADYLRDKIELNDIQSLEHFTLNSSQQGSQYPKLTTRGIHSVIIDEADSILIDQAISPLIIAAPVENELLVQAVTVAFNMISSLKKDEDYIVNREYRTVNLLASVEKKLESMIDGLDPIWCGATRRKEILIQALEAREFFIRNKDYVVQDEKIVIVDEFTGRLMPDRNWGLGMHQAIEAKENIPITPPTETLKRMSFQNFFRLFKKKGGITGTAEEARDEFWSIYQFPVVSIPRNVACQRVALPTVVSITKQEKWQKIVNFVRKKNILGQAILIGTRTIFDSEMLASIFTENDLKYTLLNANYTEFEADIISQAGQSSRITIATNMAGRGVDIILSDDVRSAGGLCVVMTELHNSKRIDRQLVGRCARQGDKGSYKIFLSLEDTLVSKNIPRFIQQSFSFFGMRESLFSLSQKRVEKQSYYQRQSSLESDKSFNESLSFVKN